MALLVPNASEITMLKCILNHTAAQDQTLKLYKSATTPAETDTAATYTVSDFSGYSDASITGTSWNFTEGGGSPTYSYADYEQQTFTADAGSQNQDQYGYYVIQASSGLLLWAEEFTDGPYNVNNNGDNVKVTMTFWLE